MLYNEIHEQVHVNEPNCYDKYYELASALVVVAQKNGAILVQVYDDTLVNVQVQVQVLPQVNKSSLVNSVLVVRELGCGVR